MAMSFMPGHDLRGGEIHRIEARGAEAVDLHARHLLAEAGLQHRRAGDVAARLADRIDAAEHDVLDQRRDRGRCARRMASSVGDGEIDRRHLVQRRRRACRARGACGRRRR